MPMAADLLEEEKRASASSAAGKVARTWRTYASPSRHRQGPRRRCGVFRFPSNRGETVGLVGESGSGKSVTALSLMRLLPQRGVRIEADRLTVMGTEVMNAGAKDLQKLRGGQVAMILQNPLRSLNPTKRVGGQIGETIRKHESLSPDEVRLKVVDLLGRVGIPEPARRAREYPHQFSGGQRQRIMIAMAIACSPGLLIADEPTTALDVTTQAQIFDLILDLRAEFGMAILLITHDLSVVARVCDRVLVMYAGRLIETAQASTLFRQPLHPYTAGLLASIPRIDQPNREMVPIRGTPLDATERVEGCASDRAARIRSSDVTSSRPWRGPGLNTL